MLWHMAAVIATQEMTDQQETGKLEWDIQMRKMGPQLTIVHITGFIFPKYIY